MPKIDMLMHGFSMGTDQGNLAFCGVTLIEGTKRILVDVAHNGRRQLLVQRLAERGLTTDDIDYVYLTHAHWDHMLNIDLFPKAKVLLSNIERSYIKSVAPHDYATPLYASAVLESMNLQDTRDGEEIDDGVTVLEVPGHSNGSSALLVRNGDVVSAICGDALPNTWAVTSGMPRLVFGDPNAASQSIRRLLDSATQFYPGHDRPFKVGDANKTTYLEPSSIRLFGFPDPGEGEGVGGLQWGIDAPRGANVVTGKPLPAAATLSSFVGLRTAAVAERARLRARESDVS